MRLGLSEKKAPGLYNDGVAGLSFESDLRFESAGKKREVCWNKDTESAVARRDILQREALRRPDLAFPLWPEEKL